MTKHTPATPLPWVQHGNDGLAVGSADLNRDGDYCGEGYTKQDAAYMAHAANAYPRLVSYLEDALVFVDYVADNGNNEADGLAHGIRTLLRELGESS